MFVFELLFQGLEFHVLDVLGRTHQGAGPDEARQFVAGEQDLFHFVLRPDVDADAVAMAGDGVDQAFVQAAFLHDFLAFDAMLFRIFFKIKVVQQACDAPEVLFPAIAEFVGKAPHDGFHRQGVAQVERVLVEFRQ